MSFEQEIRITLPEGATQEDEDAAVERIADAAEKAAQKALDDELKKLGF